MKTKMNTASIEIAIELVKQAIDQDKKKNYNEAARCYRESLILFKGVQKTKGITKGVQQAIELKCNQYEERLKKLDKWILANSDLTHIFKVPNIVNIADFVCVNYTKKYVFI